MKRWQRLALGAGIALLLVIVGFVVWAETPLGPMPEAVAGLVLWASYPPENNPLNDRDLPVLSIYGTKDMGLEGIEANRGLLPPDTQWVVMEGGNHAQFGWYGPQPGDGEATISREAQQARIVEATVAFLAVFK
jgi:pimeloyl-ACP methyl ester carboxylesterase